MDRMEAEDFSLFGLLGRVWELDAPVVDLTFDNSNGAVAFTLADGSIAIARTKDSEPAAKRIRISAEDGRSSILPRAKPLPPITRIAVQDGGPVSLTAYGKHGFVMGDASGALISLTIGGERTPLSTTLLAPILAIDHHQESGDLACATADHRVHVIGRGGGEPQSLEADHAVGLCALSPRGDLLAAVGDDRLSVWRIGDNVEKVGAFSVVDHSLALAWSPDQTRLAVGYQSGGVSVWRLGNDVPITFADYPAPVRSVAWSHDGASLVTSGAFRTIVWPIDQARRNGASPTSIDTGKPSLVAIEAVAAHPKRALIAAGYENGMLIIAQQGKADELVLKTEGRGAITAVSWSSDAGYLAACSDRGLATLIELPSQLFK